MTILFTFYAHSLYFTNRYGTVRVVAWVNTAPVRIVRRAAFVLNFDAWTTTRHITQYYVCKQSFQSPTIFFSPVSMEKKNEQGIQDECGISHWYEWTFTQAIQRRKNYCAMRRRTQNNCKLFKSKLRQTKNCKINERMNAEKNDNINQGQKNTNRTRNADYIFSHSVSYTHKHTHVQRHCCRLCDSHYNISLLYLFLLLRLLLLSLLRFYFWLILNIIGWIFFLRLTCFLYFRLLFFFFISISLYYRID